MMLPVLTILSPPNFSESDQAGVIQPDYYGFLYRRKRSAWLWAMVWAIGMNLVLFVLMSGLSGTTSDPPEFETLIPGVNIVRIKREDSPVQKIAPNVPRHEENTKPPEMTFNNPLNRNLSLPFEVNVKLPSGSTGLELPVMVTDLDLNNVFELGDLDQPLITLTRLQPVYPVHAKNKGIQGWVLVRFLVNEQGNTEEPFIVDADPPDIFNSSVINCLAGWKFRPGTVDGVAVKVLAETEIRFELE